VLQFQSEIAKMEGSVVIMERGSELELISNHTVFSSHDSAWWDA
jgi:hypothetical protein